MSFRVSPPLLILSLSLLFLIPFPLRAAEPAERIAAVVDGKIVFLSDLKRHQLFFEPQEKNGSPSGTIRERLDEVVHHRLLRVEARRFVLEGPSDAEIDRRMELIRRRFKNERALLTALDQVGLSLEELREEAREYLWVERLIEERIRSFIFISPRQIDRYYREHSEAFAGKKQEEVEPKIRERLIKERERLKTGEYLARLREQAEIEINLN